MTIAEIKSLPAKEKIILMEELWESLDENDIETPDWHEPILAERMNQLANGTAKLIPLSALKRK